MDKTIPWCIFFPRNMIKIAQCDPFRTKIDKFNFVFKESYCLWVFSSRILNVLWMSISLKNSLQQIAKVWPYTGNQSNWMYLDERLKMESDNNRQLINSLKQLNPMSAAENVLSMRKIFHGANKIKNQEYKG